MVVVVVVVVVEQQQQKENNKKDLLCTIAVDGLMTNIIVAVRN